MFLITALLFIVVSLWYIYKKLSFYYYYSKHDNVYITKSLSLLKGDRQMSLQWETENKYRFWHLMQVKLDNPNWDIRVTYSGSQPLFLIYSAKAWEEFHKLVPTKIDRQANHLKHFGRITRGGIEQIRSSKSWKQRRDLLMKTMAVNFSTRYIHSMVESFEQISKSWTSENEINLNEEMSKISFSIITKILFGEDIIDKVGFLRYYRMNGEATRLDLRNYFTLLIDDLESSSRSILNRFTSLFLGKVLVKEEKYLEKNIKNLWQTLLKWWENSNDKNSVYHKSKGKLNPQFYLGNLDLLDVIFNLI